VRANSGNAIIRHLRRAVLLQEGAGLTDGQLLAAFISRKDETAFAALVRRHGPMVLNVCRRVLRNAHDADDAFQATFSSWCAKPVRSACRNCSPTGSTASPTTPRAKQGRQPANAGNARSPWQRFLSRPWPSPPSGRTCNPCSIRSWASTKRTRLFAITAVIGPLPQQPAW